MKKLELRALELGVKELLTKEQMKRINGGTGCKTTQCNLAQGAGYCIGNGITIACQCVIGGVGYLDNSGCALA